MLKLRAVAVRSALLCAAVQGAVVAQASIQDLEVQIKEQVSLVQQLDQRMVQVKSGIIKKTRAYHQLDQSQTNGPKYFWMDDGTRVLAQRDQTLKILAMGMRENSKEMEALDLRRMEAQAQQEWLKIQLDELNSKVGNLSALGSSATADFHCARSPFPNQSELAQDFGKTRDVSTGLQWNSTGWWVSRLGGEVVACSDGTVVFAGALSGRGGVVMLDHGQGQMTIYANLSENSIKNLSKGMAVASGQRLGTITDRFYFEVRSQGIAKNPREVLSQDKLSGLTL